MEKIIGKGKEGERIYHYFVDREGRLFFENSEIIDEQVLALFFKTMKPIKEGLFIVECQGEKNFVCYQITPFIVQSLNILEDQIQLFFPGGYKEFLDFSCLFISSDQTLGCYIKQGKQPALFNRKTYYEISKYISEKEEKMFFNWENKAFPILNRK